MEIKQITVGFKRTWQTASFESLTEEVQLVAELEERDNPNASIRDLQKKAQALVQEHARPILEQSGRIEPNQVEKIAGLEVH